MISRACGNPTIGTNNIPYFLFQYHTMVCPPVRGDNPRALAYGLSHVQADNHGITISYHTNWRRLCTLRDMSCKSLEEWYKFTFTSLSLMLKSEVHKKVSEQDQEDPWEFLKIKTLGQGIICKTNLVIVLHGKGLIS